MATASGMAAEFITFAALCQAGDHIVASSQLYGGTVTQLDVSLRRFGIEPPSWKAPTLRITRRR